MFMGQPAGGAKATAVLAIEYRKQHGWKISRFRSHARTVAVLRTGVGAYILRDHHPGGKRAKGKERQRDRETDTNTDRDRDRERERQRQRETERQRGRNRQRERQRDRER